MCAPYKRAIGAVRRMAERQGQLELYKTHTAAPANKKKLLDKYVKTKGKEGKGQTLVEPKFKLATAKHEIIAEQRIKKSAKGKMMWREEYLEFAKTPAGGFLNSVESTA